MPRPVGSRWWSGQAIRGRLKAEDGLLPVKPGGHLLYMVRVLITGTVCVLGKVDMQTFRVFCTGAVSSAGASDSEFVVLRRVPFGKIEMLTDSEFDEDLLVDVVVGPRQV